MHPLPLQRDHLDVPFEPSWIPIFNRSFGDTRGTGGFGAAVDVIHDDGHDQSAKDGGNR